MCRFIQIIYSPKHNLFANLNYIPEIRNCYRKYSKYLQDDFCSWNNDIYSYLEESFPYFWVVETFEKEFAGFVSLNNFVGGPVISSGQVKEVIYSAELTTCFEKQFWGDFTKYSAKMFLKKCFDELGLWKIKVQVYPDNFRTPALLKSSGFVFEETLKSETLRNGKMQDINVYALYRDYYYKRGEL